MHAAIPTFDALNRLKRIENADGTGIEYTYDSNGNQTNRIPYRASELTLTADPPDGGAVTGSGRFRPNTTSALTATAGSAFDFVAWERPDGTVLSTAANYLHPITGHETLVARFFRIAAPAITTHPTGGLYPAGTPVSLSVSATGRGPLSYRWNRNGEALASGDQTLTLSAPTFLDAGTYSAEVSNPGGTTITNGALVSIPLTSYAQWRSGVFTPADLAANDPNIIGPLATPGDDGMTNQMHYALGVRSRAGGAPDAFRLGRLPGDPLPDSLFEYNRLIGGGGLIYRVAISSNLQNWDETEGDLEIPALPVANPDGLTERVRVRLKEPMRSAQSRTFFRLGISDFSIIFSSADDFNYFDTAEFGIPEIRSEIPVPGRFEGTPNGVLVKANRPRGGGTLITKNAFVLLGKTAEFIWSGSGGNDFMQPVCGANTKPWPTDAGNIDAYLPICTFGATYNGSWLALPGVTYATTVSFSASTAAMITVDSLTGQEYGRFQLSGMDFTQPQRLYIRTGDTKDRANAFILLKSLEIKTAETP